MKRRLENIEGKTFGKWKVIKKISSLGYREMWLCKCSCGNIKEVLGQNLRHNKTKSCGCIGKNSVFWKGYGDIPSAYFSRLIADSKRRKIFFNITIQQAWNIFLKQKGKCALSGVDIGFSNSGRSMARAKITASLDRIDSSKGYEIDNVQWVHKVINRIKHNLSDEEFFYWCNKVCINKKYY